MTAAERHGLDLIFKWGWKLWQVRCACGWESWSHPFRSAALHAHEAHVERQAV